MTEWEKWLLDALNGYNPPASVANVILNLVAVMGQLALIYMLGEMRYRQDRRRELDKLEDEQRRKQLEKGEDK